MEWTPGDVRSYRRRALIAAAVVLVVAGLLSGLLVLSNDSDAGGAFPLLMAFNGFGMLVAGLALLAAPAAALGFFERSAASIRTGGWSVPVGDRTYAVILYVALAGGFTGVGAATLGVFIVQTRLGS